MSDDIKNILPGGNDQPDNRKLLDYLNDQLNKTDSHELEKHMAEDPFINDAVEGLQEFNSKKNMQLYVKQLNNELSKQTAKKKKRKDKRKLKDQPWVYLSVIIVLLLLIICYVVIRQLN
jgi:flagellar biosynthesis/type III secretory pathway M-ring protein FliF/YscJ